MDYYFDRFCLNEHRKGNGRTRIQMGKKIDLDYAVNLSILDERVSKVRKIILQTKIRILDATVMTVVKYNSETLLLQKADEDLLDVLQRNCLRIFPGTQLIDRVSNSRRYERRGSIPLSRAIMRDRLRWLGHVLWMKDERLPKIVFFRLTTGRSWLGWEMPLRKN